MAKEELLFSSLKAKVGRQFENYETFQLSNYATMQLVNLATMIWKIPRRQIVVI